MEAGLARAAQTAAPCGRGAVAPRLGSHTTPVTAWDTLLYFIV